MMKENNAKVTVIGLDGATLDLMKPLAEKGTLPYLSRLLEEGSWGPLESVHPHSTGPAWTSFATGKHPGKHGICDFIMPRGSLSNLEPVTSSDIKAPTFYEMIANSGKNIGLVNLPVSYPPRTDQPTVTSLMTRGDNFTFPASLEEKIPALKNYRINPDPKVSVRGDAEDRIDDIRELEESRFKVAREIYQIEDPDFFFYLISGTDWIQHRHYAELVSGKGDYQDKLIRSYREFDSYLGWFLDNSDKDSTLIVMSDHGFMVRKYLFYLNTWLYNSDYLLIGNQKTEGKPAPTKKAKAEEKVKADHSTLGVPNPLLEFLNEHPSLSRAAGKIYSNLKNLLNLKVDTSLGGVDTKNSRALMTWAGSWGIYINDRERFEDGVVSKEDYHKVRKKLRRELEDLEGPADEKPVMEVNFKEEVYASCNIELFPDLLLQSSTYHPESKLLPDHFRKVTHNGHSPEGIFLARGPHIKQGALDRGLNLVDLAPTVLHLLGLPILEDMDGKVAKTIFKPNSPPLTRGIQTKSPPDKEEADTEELSEENGTEVTKRLTDLGYL